MRTVQWLSIVVVAAGISVTSIAQQPDEGRKKLNAFQGKWHAEGTLNNGQTSTTNIECRWSPQGSYMICEQVAKTGEDERHSLTIYSYDSKEGKYSYSSLPVPGAKSRSGLLELKGNIWTYDATIESVGKTIQMHSIQEFIDVKTINFKTMRSDDGGEHWNKVLEGKMQRTAD